MVSAVSADNVTLDVVIFGVAMSLRPLRSPSPSLNNPDRELTSQKGALSHLHIPTRCLSAHVRQVPGQIHVKTR